MALAVLARKGRYSVDHRALLFGLRGGEFSWPRMRMFRVALRVAVRFEGCCKISISTIILYVSLQKGYFDFNGSSRFCSNFCVTIKTR